MFWNRRNQQQEAEAWAARLAAGEQAEPTLQIAAQLQTIDMAEPPVSPFFKERLRRQIVAQSQDTTTRAHNFPTAPSRRSRGWLLRMWSVPTVMVLFATIYWQYWRVPTAVAPRVDDWQYAPTVLGTVMGNELFLPILRMSLYSFGWLFLLCLLFLVGHRLYGALFAGHATATHWTRIAQRGMWLSASMGIFLVVFGMLVFSQRGTQIASVQIASPLQPVVGIQQPVQSPLQSQPAPAAMPVEQQPAAASVVEPNAYTQMLETDAFADSASVAMAPPAESQIGTTASAELAPAEAVEALAENAPPAALYLASPAKANETAANVSAQARPVTVDEAAALGLAVGGAKDINNFRENIAQGYLPLPTDVTVEGLFYDYYFATGQTEPCDALFCPSYAQATSRDPLSGEPEHFLAVGLNSGIKASDFARKRLNLVIVLDISGSMAEVLTDYYYDGATQTQTQSPLTAGGEMQEQPRAVPKIVAATEAIAALFDHLQPDDRLSIVLFNEQAHLAKGMREVGATDMAAIRNHLLALRSSGGTNMEAGYRMATDLLADYAIADPAVYENRIIFLTDAQPNTGATGQSELLALTQDAAAQRIYTSFIGIGVDFNTALIEGLTKVRGANYYAVHSPDAFIQRMDAEFDFMVTPLLFDLTLTFDSTDYTIAKVYGSPEADAATGELMRINTLFPAASRGGAVKGGLVLLQLQPKMGEGATGGTARLTVTYTDRSGALQSTVAAITLPAAATIAQSGDQYANPGIRKGILLVRYANLLRNWIIDSRAVAAGIDDWLYPSVGSERGIPLAPNPVLGQWERQSMEMSVSTEYRKIFSEFRPYFGAEMDAVADETLAQELAILQQLGQ